MSYLLPRNCEIGAGEHRTHMPLTFQEHFDKMPSCSLQSSISIFESAHTCLCTSHFLSASYICSQSYCLELCSYLQSLALRLYKILSLPIKFQASTFKKIDYISTVLFCLVFYVLLIYTCIFLGFMNCRIELGDPLNTSVTAF